MHASLVGQLRRELDALREQGLFKEERVLQGPQGAEILVGGRRVLNFCANNYLGLASDPRVVEAARRALDRWAYGLSSVRFICGTTELHRELERELAGLPRPGGLPPLRRLLRRQRRRVRAAAGRRRRR